MHLVIPTHTTRHLAACLAGLARQTRPPRTVVVSVDGDDPAIAELLDLWWPRVARAMATACRPAAGPRPEPRLLHVSRPHDGTPRLNEVRNNALRTLDEHAAPGPDDLIVVVDGDTLLAADALEHHADLAGQGGDVIIAYRVNLTEAESEPLSPDAILGGAAPPDLGASRAASLAARQRRYRWHARARPLGLARAHKPKLLGGHHAVRAGVLRSVNGYDERFTGYGYDDDDLARRLHTLRPRPRVKLAVDTILAYHLWHPSRAPARPTLAPGYEVFRRPGWTPEARDGWRRPATAAGRPVTVWVREVAGR